MIISGHRCREVSCPVKSATAGRVDHSGSSRSQARVGNGPIQPRKSAGGGDLRRRWSWLLVRLNSGCLFAHLVDGHRNSLRLPATAGPPSRRAPPAAIAAGPVRAPAAVDPPLAERADHRSEVKPRRRAVELEPVTRSSPSRPRTGTPPGRDRPFSATFPPSSGPLPSAASRASRPRAG